LFLGSGGSWAISDIGISIPVIGLESFQATDATVLLLLQVSDLAVKHLRDLVHILGRLHKSN